MTISQPAALAQDGQRAVQPVIDCDIHPIVPTTEALFPYLTDYWREQIQQSGFKGPIDTAYPASAATSLLPGLAGAPKDVPAQLGRIHTQALEPHNAAYGILNCDYAVDSLHNPDAAAALSSAVNQWLIAEWLDHDPRLRASVVVPSQHPELAAREIERVGGHPGFVQVLLPVRAAAPYGDRRYFPIYEAAVRHGLVLGIQSGGFPGSPPTPVGWPSFYIEEYAGMASVFQSQLLSIVSAGVFEQFPALQVALLESGCTWLPSLLWRFDKEWKGLRREVPWVRQRPSDYIREHVRLTIQPFDAPPDLSHILRLIDQIGSEELLLFASDYPHAHGDPIDPAFLGALPDGLAAKIKYGNARTLYRLP